MAHYQPHESESWHHLVRAATTKLDQKAIVQQKPATFSFKFVKIQTSFHKNDPTGTLNGLQLTKPWKIKVTGATTRPHAPTRGHNLRKPQPSPSNMCKSTHDFRKRTTPGEPACLDLQNLEIPGPNDEPRAATRLQKFRQTFPSSSRAAASFTH